MKPRTPKSIAGALTKVMTALSDVRCAEIVGRSDSLIRKWADPDHPSQPTLAQALALDMVYVKEGHGEPPILEIYQELLADALSERDDREADILITALSIQSAVGSLSEAIKAAVDPNGPGGLSITASERQNILEILDRLEDHTDVIEDAVEIR
jgi:hypothetical protein